MGLYFSAVQIAVRVNYLQQYYGLSLTSPQCFLSHNDINNSMTQSRHIQSAITIVWPNIIMHSVLNT